MAVPRGLEPPTFGLGNRRSRLSFERRCVRHATVFVAPPKKPWNPDPDFGANNWGGVSRPHAASMNDPRRHHYNPEFYLGEWAGADDLVCEIKKAYGKVEARRKSPKASGFERDLYRTVGLPDEQHVEKNFLSRFDNDAARALQKSCPVTAQTG